jgi:hypothetical protein
MVTKLLAWWRSRICSDRVGDEKLRRRRGHEGRVVGRAAAGRQAARKVVRREQTQRRDAQGKEEKQRKRGKEMRRGKEPTPDNGKLVRSLGSGLGVG